MSWNIRMVYTHRMFRTWYSNPQDSSLPPTCRCCSNARATSLGVVKFKATWWRWGHPSSSRSWLRIRVGIRIRMMPWWSSWMLNQHNGVCIESSLMTRCDSSMVVGFDETIICNWSRMVQWWLIDAELMVNDAWKWPMTGNDIWLDDHKVGMAISNPYI